MIKEIMEKITATKTTDELHNLIVDLNNANTCNKFDYNTNMYIQNAIYEHYEHLKNPCYEG